MTRDPSRTPRNQQTASQRFCAAIGKPHPRPLTADELAEFDALQDQVDADLARRYGNR